jgi:hypothetical protein
VATLTLNFQHDGKNEDGSDFDATQFAGVTYAIDFSDYVSVPAAFAEDGNYEVVADVVLEPNTYDVAVKMMHIDGTASIASNIATFEVEPVARVANAPFGLTASFSR